MRRRTIIKVIIFINSFIYSFVRHHLFRPWLPVHQMGTRSEAIKPGGPRSSVDSGRRFHPHSMGEDILANAPLAGG